MSSDLLSFREWVGFACFREEASEPITDGYDPGLFLGLSTES